MVGLLGVAEIVFVVCVRINDTADWKTDASVIVARWVDKAAIVMQVVPVRI